MTDDDRMIEEVQNFCAHVIMAILQKSKPVPFFLGNTYFQATPQVSV